MLVLAGVLLPAAARAERWMWLHLPDGSRLLAEVADTRAGRMRGLMYRASLPPDRLMLLHYPADGTRRVWMKNCRFPLDVAWIDGGGRVVAVARDLPPCPADPCPQYGPDAPARHIVEGTAGWLAAHGVTEGARIELGAWTTAPGSGP